MSVPKEIRVLGAAEVAKYLEDLQAQGAKRLNEARIIILGDKGAGKTCLARRLINPDAQMTKMEDSTAGVDTTLWELEQDDMNVRIWDFAGHTVTHAVHQLFLSERCLYIMVYDGRTEERNRLDYWLDHMKNYGGDSQAMIFINRRDQNKVEIPLNTLNEKYPIQGVYEFSIQDDKAKLEDFRAQVAGCIKNNPSWNKLEIPENNYQVKEALETIFIRGDKENGKEHITKEEFIRIAKEHGVENVDDLLTRLHALGVSLWYQKMEEFNTLVLNPEWISQGVYQIINWVRNEKKGHQVALSEFQHVFQENSMRYPNGKHIYLYRLMLRYELAYEAKDEKELVIPHLLKEDRPKNLPDFPIGESLMLRYKAEQPLPPDTILRFIVRHSKEIKNDKSESVWRYGVILHDGKGSQALVREEDRTISVAVKGSHKTEYISCLRETLNDIFKSYKSEKPELQYRIVPYGEIPEDLGEKTPLWLSDRKIINHFVDDVPYYEDTSRRYIQLNQTIKNYNIKAGNVITESSGEIRIMDQSKHINFNFEDCNIDLQSNLNDLAGLLSESGKKEDAKELENTVAALEKVETCKSPEEVKKSGIKGKLQRLMNDLEDENSKLHKTVKGIKNGVSVAQDIAKRYNDIAQWVGWPQVPQPFLKK